MGHAKSRFIESRSACPDNRGFIEEARRVGTGAVSHRTYRGTKTTPLVPLSGGKPRSESVYLFLEFTRK